MQLFGGKLEQSDKLLAQSEEPMLGAHLVTPRLGFCHHGIYIGEGKVVHYGTLGRYRIGGPVEEVSLAGFGRGRIIWVRRHERVRFGRAEVVRRARSRVGEDRYRLLSNNCEHFCEWCLQGEQRSYQVESLLSLPRQLERMFGALVARLLTVPPIRIWVESDRP